MERLQVYVLFLVILHSIAAEFACKAQNGARNCSAIDLEALDDFKNGMNDPENRLSSWQGRDCFNPDDVTRYGFWNLSGKIRPTLIKIQSLKYLDLSLNTFGGIPIPRFVPGLVSLKYFDMNQVELSMVGSSWLKMLNQLPHLTELHLSSCGLSGSIPLLTPVNFTSLAVIDLSFNSFNSMLTSWLVNISSLEYIDLSNSGFRGGIPLGISEIQRLRYLNLALNNNLSADCLELFRESWEQIKVLDLGSNKQHGKLPRSTGNMTYLTHFSLLLNNIEGGIPSIIGGLCNLIRLGLSGNNLTGGLVGKLPKWLGQLKNLQQLGLASNSFEGPIPASLGKLQKFTNVGLSVNQLNGTPLESFGQLSELSVLDVSLISLQV
ncbi:leucine-rich repeat receptor protein kinase MSP1-like [Lycium barbarum]|uniref:leucine-rich repeat receptor protein kinase MSP1-like n=1 Tax=Lycium barbarum TaxID=112863 RepID=UPI00293F36B8|nr:leucine-rich repeat receptor protein kinase MSP1-like [Lycium barbarum]